MMKILNNSPWFQILGLCGSLLGPLTGAEKASLSDVIDAIERKENVSSNLKALAELPKETLVHRKLESTLLELLTATSLTKSQRLEALTLCRELSISKEVLSQNKLADTLIKMEPVLSSPNLKLLVIDCLLDFDTIESSATQSKIATLKQAIITDAAKPTSRQRYASTLHAACLKTVGGPKTKSTVINTIIDLLAEEDDQKPNLRLALYQAVVNLCNTNPSTFKKSNQVDVTKSLINRLSKHPALSTTGANKTEIKDLSALLPAVGQLLRRDLGTGLLKEGTQALLKTLAHPNTAIVKTGGQALVSIANANLPKSDLEIEDQLIKASQSSSLKGEEDTARVTIFADLLTHRFQNLVSGDGTKGVYKKTEQCLSFFQQLFNAPNISIKHKGMDGFFVLEPSVFENKTIDSNGVKIIKRFVSTCINDVMGNEKFEASLPPGFLPRMAEVLHEICGQDLGTEKKLWSNWMRTEGQTFFN